MKRRFKMSKGSSRHVFSRSARGVHRKNVPSTPMRGGIRL